MPYNVNLDAAEKIWTESESNDYDKALEQGNKKEQTRLLLVAVNRAHSKGINIKSKD